MIALNHIKIRTSLSVECKTLYGVLQLFSCVDAKLAWCGLEFDVNIWAICTATNKKNCYQEEMTATLIEKRTHLST